MINDIIPTEKRKNCPKCYFESKFSYCSLIWMFCSTNIINTINKLREIAYNDYISIFEQLLEIDSYTNIHQRNLRALATEMYIFSHNLSPYERVI